ncbi:RDD family protein [Zooshikella ganghwensis]|uniref:RDD family protein n=1 Tax=Zooshikella ganghwensis TaxID=202772 RepID=A0A4V1IPA2_9GAMM|nr:RDD family protein [Zooshikella ganghwensis]RDH46521.1 RDD family protein [Zooshikella ganghwensis]
MSDSHNVYQTPSSDLAAATPMPEDGELASRWSRLGASLIDAFILNVISMPVLYAAGYFDGALSGQQPSFTSQSMAMLFSLVLFIILHGYFLAKSGQTIGKKILGISIVSYRNNTILGLGNVLALRYLPLWIVLMIPYVGMIAAFINPLFIFNKEKRCLHDFIAGTKVIKVGKKA